MSDNGAGDWSTVASTADEVIAECGAAFSSKARAQMYDFLHLIRDRCPIPEIVPGYWRTSVCFCWKHTAREPIEVECLKTVSKFIAFSTSELKFGMRRTYRTNPS